MSVTLRLAAPDDLDRLAALVEACHGERGLNQDPAQRREVLKTLLDGIPNGVAYLIGPPKAPVGYLVISFGFSVEMGGLDGHISDFFIRPGVRGRGMGSEAVMALAPALARHGVKALHIEVPGETARLVGHYRSMGFAVRDGRQLMTRRL
ncbi:GNAT family N-acetyltransferase [Oceaniglobus roseus]|uniref:GNAT family N-acetyltransferase n=1 Tax=Oceaniglobus roseus TaxID=1737570 RepID=UPI000C7ED729|nr:GNAT family N-acetyltransferase [Kandeliimicrobium roseum]